MERNMTLIFSKDTNLLPYAKSADKITSDAAYERYAKSRAVTLILRVRRVVVDGTVTKTLCTINCPINPLPVKGEFEVPSMHVIIRFLCNNDWKIVTHFASIL